MSEPREDTRDPVDGVFKCLGSVEKVEPKWIIKDLLPVGLVVVAGPAKEAYKSTWLGGMALLASGHPHTGFPPELSQAISNGVVQIHSAEASAEEMREDLENAYDLKIRHDSSIIVADDAGVWQLDDDDGVERFIKWLDNNKPIMWAIDPWRNFQSQDENDSRALIQMLRPLRQWCKDNDSAGVVVHHTTKLVVGKQTEYNAASIRGTGALHGLVDGAIIITPMAYPLFQIEAQFKRGRSWKKEVKLNIRTQSKQTIIARRR